MSSENNDTKDQPTNQNINLPQYIKSTYTILNSPNTKNSQVTLDSFKEFISITLPQKEKTEELFNVISNYIFISKENKKISKDPFILFPIIFSSNPKLSMNYIDNILVIINQTIEDVNRPLFSFISQIFGQIINSMYHNSSTENNILLGKPDQEFLYRKLLNFCLNDIKLNKKNEQTCGCLYLTELIENCPLVKENDYLKELWETISGYIDDKLFFAKLEILNCIISLIFAAETKFKPFANVALFKILDYLTDNDWMKRKLSLNVVYTLSFYCREEIIPLKEYIIEFLNVLKNDKITEVKEVCLQTLKFLQENEEESENSVKSQSIAKSAELSKRENSRSMKFLKVKKSTAKKKQRSISMSNSVENYNNTVSGLSKAKGKTISVSKGSSAQKKTKTQLNKDKSKEKYENDKIVKIQKERRILDQIEKDILERRAKTPVLHNDDTNINGGTKKIVLRAAKNNDRPKTPTLCIENKEENEKIENTVGNIPLKGSNESFKIKVGKSSDKKSANKELNLSEEKKIEVKENLQDKFEEPKVSSNDTNLPLQQTKSKDELKVESSQQDQSSIKTLSDEIKKISQMQESILSSISKLTQTVNSNYTELDKRVSKLESSLLELIKSNSVNTNSLHGNIIDKEWQKILTEIEQGNYANAINLSVSNDEYLFKCISKLPTDKVKSIDTTAIEDILSRLIVLIPRGDNLDVMIPFCETIIKNKVQLKKITKQNLKDVISYISSHRNNFILSEETNKKIDSLTLYFSSD